ncbi:MAG: hypothetical protein U0572_00445 [Phycisphaerales bacterium]
MPRPRWIQVNDAVGGVYHCISRCVRRLALLARRERLEWIVARLAMLASAFAIDVCDLAAMINHLHLMLRTHPELAMAWDPEEVATRWLTVMPNITLRRALGIDADTPQPEEIAIACSDKALIAEWRWRLSNLGWFHRLLKEPCARAWNRQDDVPGPFWEGRYRSIACCDERSLLVQSAYVVLNPVHCGRAAELEECEWTSLPLRLRQVEAEMRQGMHVAGRQLCDSALLTPALPCDPGRRVPAMDDAEFSRRIAQSAWERALRELAVDEARRLSNEASRFARVAIGRASATVGHHVPEAAPAEPPHPAARLLRTVPRERPRAPIPAAPGQPHARLENRWRGGLPLPLVAGCTVAAFVEFVDDCGRVARPDKAGYIAPAMPRAIETLRVRIAGGSSLGASPTRDVHWTERLTPVVQGLVLSAIANVTRAATRIAQRIGLGSTGPPASDVVRAGDHSDPRPLKPCAVNWSHGLADDPPDAKRPAARPPP